MAFAGQRDPRDPIMVAFDDAIVAMVVSDPTLPDNPLIYVNKAFEDLTGFAAVEVIGRNCRFLQGPLTVADDVVRLRAAIAKAERIEMDLLNHRRDGTPFWNRLILSPVFDDAGRVRYFVASQLDVTVERHRVIQLQQDHAALTAELTARERALAEREMSLAMALKAGGLGTWTYHPGAEEMIASPSCKAVFGRPLDVPFTYAQFIASLHPGDLPGVTAALRATIEDGAPYRVEHRILTPVGEQRWLSVQGEMQYRADGTPLAVTGFASDISARKFAEEHRSVLAHELTHRVKNTLATVGAVVSQTLRDAASLDDAREAVEGRIASLGAAHELLLRDEIDGAAIGDIVDKVLAPFTDRDGRRITASGPAIHLTPEVTLALSMALHELATNAVKYGALSTGAGRVVIVWALIGAHVGRRFTFSWIEEGGPPVVQPTRTGFGTRMIERVLSRHVRGTATIRYLAEGVRFAIEAPI